MIFCAFSHTYPNSSYPLPSFTDFIQVPCKYTPLFTSITSIIPPCRFSVAKTAPDATRFADTSAYGKDEFAAFKNNIVPLKCRNEGKTARTSPQNFGISQALAEKCENSFTRRRTWTSACAAFRSSLRPYARTRLSGRPCRAACGR